ncbi:MAG: chemotaxis protein CheW [Fimbriimonadaceae bacterium]|nr:chemotaxis protein CheW [Fimbriimonadaceae bacterium]
MDAAEQTQSLATEHQTVIFRLGSEHFGIEIFRVNEIIRLREITPIPGTDHHVKGLINLRGKTIPIVDLRLRFGLPEAEPTDTTRIVVVDTDHGDIGMVVDAVSEVRTLRSVDLEEAPILVQDRVTDYVWSLAKDADRIITLVDLDKALAA